MNPKMQLCLRLVTFILLTIGVTTPAFAQIDELWLVTHAEDVTDSEGNPLFANGYPVNIVELDQGPSVANVSHYWWLGLIRLADGSCSTVPGLFGKKITKSAVASALCGNGSAFRALYLSGPSADAPTVSVRLECLNQSYGIFFKEPGSGNPGIVQLQGDNTGASPFPPVTIFASVCPAGFVSYESVTPAGSN